MTEMKTDTWPPTWKGSNFKTSRTAAKVEKHVGRRKQKKAERDNKGDVRKRDGHRCRFPHCGCRKLGLALEARVEVSHDKHKGMGGNPAGDRSAAALMITLCLHRHQDSAISRHKGTLRTIYLTAKKNDGPIEWAVDVETLLRICPGLKLPRRSGWLVLAREKKVQQLEPLFLWQLKALEALADRMDF